MSQLLHHRQLRGLQGPGGCQEGEGGLLQPNNTLFTGACFVSFKMFLFFCGFISGRLNCSEAVTSLYNASLVNAKPEVIIVKLLSPSQTIPMSTNHYQAGYDNMSMPALMLRHSPPRTFSVLSSKVDLSSSARDTDFVILEWWQMSSSSVRPAFPLGM